MLHCHHLSINVFDLFTEKQSRPPWVEPNFSTECFYLTLHCHHLSIIPIMRKYQRRIRAIRDLNRMIDEMEGNHPQWKSQVQVCACVCVCAFLCVVSLWVFVCL